LALWVCLAPNRKYSSKNFFIRKFRSFLPNLVLAAKAKFGLLLQKSQNCTTLLPKQKPKSNLAAKAKTKFGLLLQNCTGFWPILQKSQKLTKVAKYKLGEIWL